MMGLWLWTSTKQKSSHMEIYFLALTEKCMWSAQQKQCDVHSSSITRVSCSMRMFHWLLTNIHKMLWNVSVMKYHEYLQKWQTHPDNTPAQSAQLVKQFSSQHSTPYVRQPPYYLWLFVTSYCYLNLKTPPKAKISWCGNKWIQYGTFGDSKNWVSQVLPALARKVE